MEKVINPILAIVVPCHNEQEVLSSTFDTLNSLVLDLVKDGSISPVSFVGFIDDGSQDKTWSIIEDLQKNHKHIKAIKLTRNYGHQNALLAGLNTFHTEADILVSIDADLQDDVNVIPEMISRHKEGFEIVYGVRSKRDQDTLFKKYSALMFYKIMKLLGVVIIYNHADFRLTSKKVIQALEQYTEENIFLRGIFPSIGFPSTSVYYNRTARTAGKSKYSIFRMFGFAWEGITSFSIKPLRLVTVMGFIVFFISLILTAYVIIARYYLQVVHGWASTVIPIYVLGGIQLLAIGIIGEYLGKIYQETKRRPRYFVEKKI